MSTLKANKHAILLLRAFQDWAEEDEQRRGFDFVTLRNSLEITCYVKLSEVQLLKETLLVSFDLLDALLDFEATTLYRGVQVRIAARLRGPQA
jgi:hypothetical protein